MIRLTLLRHGGDTIGTAIKHRSEPSNRMLAFTEVRRPVVFWNITSRCNLSCPQCYISAGASSANELSTAEAMALMDDLASMRVPLLMFTGGEPLLRPDFWELADYARDLGMKTAVSTNGTLIRDDEASRLKGSGVEYVGVSLEGATEGTHDRVRGPGSFGEAIKGLEACVGAGLKCGIRVTATKDNFEEISALLDLTAVMGVPRFCLYWLVPSGRGRDSYLEKQLDQAQVEEVFRVLYDASKAFDPDTMEILTVDAPQDGAYLLDQLSRDGDPELEHALTLLNCTGDSCSAGDRVANVDPQGNVYPCQFLQMEEQRIGNVRTEKFSSMWNDVDNPVLQRFRNKKAMLQGQCVECSSGDICAGGCKARALHGRGSIWAPDPFCTKAD
jgi:radical SAM protein with 4Fe4S-binding SPASM domain